MKRHEIANHIDLLLGRIGCQEPVEEIRKHHIEDTIDAILADSEADLATAQERLAVMAEALRAVEWVANQWSPESGYSRMCPWCMGHEDREGHAPDCRRQKALSAAPAGQVVWREMVVGTTESIRDEELTKFDGPGGTLWVTEWLLDDDQNGAEFMLTVYQATSAEQGGQ